MSLEQSWLAWKTMIWWISSICLFGIFFISYLINWFFFVSLFVFSSWYNLFGFDFFGFFSRFLFCHNLLFKIFFFFFLRWGRSWRRWSWRREKKLNEKREIGKKNQNCWSFVKCVLSFASASGGRSGRFERHLEDAVAQRVAVERLNSDESFVVVRHGDETEAFAFIGLQVADDFDALDGAEGTKQLPQDTFLRIGRQIVHENTPACSLIKITSSLVVVDRIDQLFKRVKYLE